jgi:hypothetical protein
VAQAVTPSGLEIYYQAGPKRLYRIFDVNKHDWIEVPSVSTILEVLEKGGLSWWGMKVGIEGVRELARMNVLVPADFELDQLDGSDPDAWTTDAIVRSMTEHKLTVNYTKDKAATRGTNVHTALETWAETGVIPDPQFFPENERGYVEGLGAFLRDATPLPHHTELMVASTAGFAGRFDMVASISGNIVTKTYPKKAPIRKQLSGRWLLDLKTSKGVYPSYKLQLGAYRGGLVECGYEDVDHAGVVRVTPEGKYELVESHATLEKDKDGVWGDGQILSDKYRWLISFYPFGFHIMVGRSGWRSPYPRSRFSCWLHTGHHREVNNPHDPTRLWWCRGCGTVWPER